MYSTHNEVKTVVTERWFTRTLNGKKSNKVTANKSKYYLGYLNKLAGQYNKLYHHSLVKHLFMLNILLWRKKLRQILNHLNSKTVIESGLLSIRIFLVRVTSNVSKENYFLLIVFWKLILGRIKLKI